METYYCSPSLIRPLTPKVASLNGPHFSKIPLNRPPGEATSLIRPLPPKATPLYQATSTKGHFYQRPPLLSGQISDAIRYTTKLSPLRRGHFSYKTTFPLKKVSLMRGWLPYCERKYNTLWNYYVPNTNQSSRWAPVQRHKISKALFGPVNFSICISIYKINWRIRFGPLKSNFHFEDCYYLKWVKEHDTVSERPVFLLFMYCIVSTSRFFRIWGLQGRLDSLIHL